MDPNRNYASWVKVASSNVDAVIWHEDRGTGRPVFSIRFLSSPKVYDFHGVPDNVYHGMLQASSKGKYFNERIKGRYYCPQVK